MNPGCPSAPPCSATGKQIPITSNISPEAETAASPYQDVTTATPNLHSSLKASDKVLDVHIHPVAAATYLFL